MFRAGNRVFSAQMLAKGANTTIATAKIIRRTALIIIYSLIRTQGLETETTPFAFVKVENT